MIRFKIVKDARLQIKNVQEGERIETKIERVVHNNEPIKDGAPLIYTDRKEGVKASTNIRTDRFDVALDATDKIARSYKARREDKAEMKVSKSKNEGDVVEDKSVQGKTKSGEK